MESFEVLVSSKTQKDNLVRCITTELSKKDYIDIVFCGAFATNQVVKSLTSARKILVLKNKLDFNIEVLYKWVEGKNKKDKILVYVFRLLKKIASEEILEYFLSLKKVKDTSDSSSNKDESNPSSNKN